MWGHWVVIISQVIELLGRGNETLIGREHAQPPPRVRRPKTVAQVTNVVLKRGWIMELAYFHHGIEERVSKSPDSVTTFIHYYLNWTGRYWTV